jgi:hypothetical protein
MWRKQGLVFGPDGTLPWARNSALTPTPVLLGDQIRVFAGFRDDAGVSRIGYVDVDAQEPTRVIAVGLDPALDIGAPGMFDDNGVILGDIVPDGTGWRMYYVGFQLVAKAKFLAFTGLATSDDCTHFRRVSQTPVLDRTDEGMFIRAIHTARQEAGEWRIWYAAGRGWTRIGETDYPSYEIRTARSLDGISFPDKGTLCLPAEGNEYRIGRPRVMRTADGYEMLFTKGTVGGDYTPGWAGSADGIHWHRQDSRFDLPLSESGWDSKTLCYPAPLMVGDRQFLFYNGNEMGKAGFGVAEWIA